VTVVVVCGMYQVSPVDDLALTFITYIGCTLSIVCLTVAFLCFQFSRSTQPVDTSSFDP